jgi:hypothetical protein
MWPWSRMSLQLKLPKAWKIRSKPEKQARPPRRRLILPPDQEDAVADLIERGISMAAL